ncbi:hypothetical protein [Nocardiopsis sp. NRRL B-16309]|uniref:hypothetical protein n=1 Tax=Nocardiopsis sp. NRRL B-16309 TaxID=1519494 RepID=UPI0006AE8541|nr:hypothetical protein [Nocardiopsis sp. NRRL B-16309]KOX10145.1 hypothetical protein ADL05_26075 [Nocardiopsis sp. NRRL B-16309]
MELDLLDRGHDIVDFYRGHISFRRLALLVIHDMARMPRTRAAVNGMDADRPWDETNTQLAVIDTRLQSLLRVAWVGGRLQHNPPDVNPYPIPTAKGDQQQSQARRPDPRKQAYLERFAPPKRHLTLVKTPPTSE